MRKAIALFLLIILWPCVAWAGDAAIPEPDMAPAAYLPIVQR